MVLSSSKIQKILERGKFYYPATAHYPQMANCTVNCDYCSCSRLTCCIGYKNMDLCMKCVDRHADVKSGPVATPVPPPLPSSTVVPPLPVPEPLTLMMQDSVTSPWCLTRMAQDSVRLQQRSTRRIDFSPWIGKNVDDTVEGLKALYSTMNVVSIERGSLVTADYRRDRIRVYYDPVTSLTVAVVRE